MYGENVGTSQGYAASIIRVDKRINLTSIFVSVVTASKPSSKECL
jgi:hypothetical protein